MKEDLDLYEEDQEKVEEILISLLGVVDSPLPSLTHAEKEIFILCKSNPEIQKYFEFEEHYYGAYSQVLEETLDEPLFYEDAFQIEKDGIHLTRQGKKLYNEILDKYKDNEEFKVLLIALKLIREVYDKLSTEELIFLLYFTYPECGKYSNVYERLIGDKQKRKNLTNNLYRKGIITERRYEELLGNFLKQNNSSAEILTFDTSCHSVQEAADNLKTSPANLIKSICMIDGNDSLIVAIVRGNDRASSKKISKALSIEKLRVATPEEMLEKTGYPCGGTPPFGYQATFLIDTKVMENNIVYGGGGSEFSLVRISTSELKKLNNAQILRISK